MSSVSSNRTMIHLEKIIILSTKTNQQQQTKKTIRKQTQIVTNIQQKKHTTFPANNQSIHIILCFNEWHGIKQPITCPQKICATKQKKNNGRIKKETSCLANE